jgi:hypothetical protein
MPHRELIFGGIGMEAGNFGPLRQQWPNLHGFGTQAEEYVHLDPQVALFKLRCFAETLVVMLYQNWGLTSPGANFFEMLKAEAFREKVDPVVLQKFHTIRMVANNAVHGTTASSSDAARLLKDAYLLGKWLYLTHSCVEADDYPEYVDPLSQPATNQARTPEAHAQALEEALDELRRMAEANAQLATENAELRDHAKVQDILDSAVRAAAKVDFKGNDTSNLVSIQDVFAGYELTDGQEMLVDKLGKFLAAREESIFLLKGYAGTGKTFITKGLTEYLRALGRNFVLMAPTGKASKVIATKTGSDARTIHSAIYAFDDLVEYRDREDDGTLTYKYYASLRNNDAAVDTVYIVDEASMVSDNYQESEFFRFGSGHLLRDLLAHVNLDHNDHRKKVIFIGDAAQLPPVGMSTSPALSAEYLRREYSLASTEHELVEVVRQKAESGVLTNALRLREAIRARKFNQISVDFSKQDVEKVEDQDFMERYLQACNRKIIAGAIVVAQSNADVSSFNQTIRAHFFPGQREVTAGDKVISVSNSTAPGFFLSNGDFGLVRSVLGEPESRTIVLRKRSAETKDLQEIPVTLTFRDALLVFRNPDGTPCEFKGKILENLLYSKDANLSSDESKALYIDFRIRNPGLDRDGIKRALRADPSFNAYRLKFGYAITCHKAQGSEWEHVFVSCHSHMNQLSADYFRWLYTAVTRTSGRLYLLGAPEIKLGARMKAIEWGRPTDATSLNLPSGNDATIASNGEPGSCVGGELGIPHENAFLLTILTKVKGLIATDLDVRIEEVIHGQYRESYYFAKDESRCRIDISYNGKGKLSGLLAPSVSEFSTYVLGLLVPLKGAVVTFPTGARSSERVLSKDFLREFDAALEALVTGIGARIDSAHEQAWSVRYCIVRDDERAVVDVYYNGREQMTRFAPIWPLSTSKALVNEVESILENGFD